jgi:CheY-like chemotaxis protein
MQIRNIRVAVVDDDSSYQFLTSRTIRSIGHTNVILQFYDGSEAIHYLSQYADDPIQLPDLLLLDINMPRVDGWMFLEEFSSIKNRISKEINIIMVSSSIDSRDIARARQNKNILDYVMKPVSAEKFRELLDTKAA